MIKPSKESSLKKREDFAVQIRHQKRKELLSKRRELISLDSNSSQDY